MVILVPTLSGYASIVYVAVSLPRVEADNVPKQPSRDLRRMRQTPRAPSLRMMVKLAARCDSAQELGERLLKRYQRKETHREAVELDARLDRLLASPD